MKVEINKLGWTEITTTEIKITKVAGNIFKDSSVKEWIASNKRLKLDKKRKSCNCCHVPWESITGTVNLIFTNKGNKVICDSCLEKLTGEL